MGYASAMAWVLLLIIAVLHRGQLLRLEVLGLLRRLRRRRTHDRAAAAGPRRDRRGRGSAPPADRTLGAAPSSRPGDALPAALDGGQLAASRATRSSASPGLLPERAADSSNYADGWNALTAPVRPLPAELARSWCSAAIVGNLVSCSLAAYAFARLEFTGKQAAGSRSCCGTIMLPIHVMIVPQYILFSQARLDQHVPAADRAEVAGHRRVLHLPDGAVHPRHPARAGRGGPDRRLRARPASSCGSSCR